MGDGISYIVSEVVTGLNFNRLKSLLFILFISMSFE